MQNIPRNEPKAREVLAMAISHGQQERLSAQQEAPYPNIVTHVSIPLWVAESLLTQLSWRPLGTFDPTNRLHSMVIVKLPKPNNATGHYVELAYVSRADKLLTVARALPVDIGEWMPLPEPKR